jgi:hypothetical protein
MGVLVWWVGDFVVSRKVLHTLGQGGVFSHDDQRSGLEAVPWPVWLLVLLWPLTALVVGEHVKAHDTKLYDRDMKFLQLEFDTRLGQYSPR